MDQKNYTPGSIVTLAFDNIVSSNTYLIEADAGESVLLHHPLFPDALIRRSKQELDLVSPNVKDSIERALDFVKNSSQYLDYNTLADHEAICMYFVIRRKLTPRQKSTLSNICGTIASIKLNNDIKIAMELVTQNSAVLDDFNLMWFRNFNGLFTGKQPITSKKQRSAIFNIAGFVLAELERPSTSNDIIEG